MTSTLSPRTPDRARLRPPAAGAIGHDAGFRAIAVALFVVMAYNAVPAPLYGIYVQRDHFSSFMVTVIYAAYAVGVIGSLFAAGHLSDWLGRRRLYVPVLILTMVSAAVFLVWRDLPGLILARVIGGLGTGIATATATAWLGELHHASRPDAGPRRAIAVANVANLGGIGAGPLVAGVLAQWVRGPLTVPYVVSLGAMAVALVGVLVTPETRPALDPRPRYRTQRVSVPSHSVGRFLAAALAVSISYAIFGLFTSLSGSVLAGPLHHPSLALSGATTFVVYVAGTVVQVLMPGGRTRPILIAGLAAMVPGLAIMLLALWLASPSLVLFIVGGVVTGAGAGALFKGAFTVAGEIAPPDRRAETMAGIFIAGYLGLSAPVVGLGVLAQYLSVKLGLLIFTGVLVAGAVLAVPRLLAQAGAR